jgi:cytochrome c2/cbb3-type cytochrome oxidase cytochrome c subunit
MPATDNFRWNQKTLNVVFAASSVFLLASVIVMMKQDQADEWKVYQRTNFELDATVRRADLAAIESAEYKTQVEELDKKVAEAAADLEATKAKTPELFSGQEALQRKVDKLEIDLKFKNSDRDEARAQYDLAVRDALSEVDMNARFKLFQDKQALCNSTKVELDAAKDLLAARTVEVKAVTADYDGLVAAREKLSFETERVRAAVEKIEPSNLVSSWKRAMMELPIIDGFNSHLRIVQDWMPKLKQTLGMAEIARFDRCRSCHQNIDKTSGNGGPAFPAGHPTSDDIAGWVSEKKFPQPYSTHPNTELYCTASSPHPVAKFGCTICHDGQGSGTSFGNAEHTPNDPQISHEWHGEYGFHPNHFWEYPMQPSRFAESTCIKCHHSVTELGVNPKFGASAPKVFQGYQLIQKYGCYGCHEMYGFDGGVSIGPDMRLEPQTEAEATRIAADPTQVAGKLRKVGPSLRHIATKTTESFIQYWTEIPQRFRPSTKMPQFFALSEHLSEADAAHTKEFEAAELAGISKVLLGTSEPMDLLSPKDDYVADVERGKRLFSERGCMACHQHGAVPGGTSDFGPNISDIHQKVLRNSDDVTFSDWLYTWLREPERYHKRTKMPNLYLDSYLDNDGTTVIDPAADITAFLLSQGPVTEFPSVTVKDEELDNLVALYLQKTRFSQSAARGIIESGSFPQKKADVVGDEQALASEEGVAVSDPAAWRDKKLEYVGRKTIARYGCYACHDMPGYEMARPIGVALQDWGRKDTSKLGFEHIEEFLHHHGEPAGSQFASTAERVEQAHEKAEAGGKAAGLFTEEEEVSEMSASFFYDSIQRHGRPGFAWQKLRAPRSYDYAKTETKGYDERLRMPKFPLKEEEIEAIATFVLGMVAAPPAKEYVYAPDEAAKNRIEGEFLMAKYNCTSCHLVDMPTITFAADLDEITPTEITPADHEKGLELLLKMRPPRQALTGETKKVVIDDEKKILHLATVHGLVASRPDPEEEPEFREHGFDLWETADFGTGEDAKRLLPGSRLIVPDSQMVSYKDARGGAFAEWLVENLMESKTGGNRSLAWQASPPPLYQEGFKVQTQWLYQFLLEPTKIRYTTVLRMPKFNMSEGEARVLANYFAASDGAAFPYQENGASTVDYLASAEGSLVHAGLLGEDQSYLAESWKTLNGPLCVKCHSLGGKKFKVSDPAKDIQGPNLNAVQNRLRADWVKLWLYKPTWITPYTSMPVNYPKNNTTQFPDLFKGDPDAQVTATRDALLNYTRLMEDIGQTSYAPAAPATEPAPAEQAAGAGAEE